MAKQLYHIILAVQFWAVFSWSGRVLVSFWAGNHRPNLATLVKEEKNIWAASQLGKGLHSPVIQTGINWGKVFLHKYKSHQKHRHHAFGGLEAVPFDVGAFGGSSVHLCGVQRGVPWRKAQRRDGRLERVLLGFQLRRNPPGSPGGAPGSPDSRSRVLEQLPHYVRLLRRASVPVRLHHLPALLPEGLLVSRRGPGSQNRRHCVLLPGHRRLLRGGVYVTGATGRSRRLHGDGSGSPEGLRDLRGHRHIRVRQRPGVLRQSLRGEVVHGRVLHLFRDLGSHRGVVYRRMHRVSSVPVRTVPVRIRSSGGSHVPHRHYHLAGLQVRQPLFGKLETTGLLPKLSWFVRVG